MHSRISISLLVVLLAAGGLAAADDSPLLRLAMPDATVVIGISIDRIKLAGAGYEQVMTPEFKAEFDKSGDTLKEQLGYDLRDLQEILIALRPATEQGGGQGLLALRGPFDPDQPPAVMAMLPTERTTYQGVTLLTSKPGKGDPVAIAFLERSALLLGDPASVRAAIDRRAASPGQSSPLLAKAADMSRMYHIWCVAHDPKSVVPSGLPLPAAATGPFDAAFQSVEEVTAGLLLAPGFKVYVDLVARSEKDAGALRDTLASSAGDALKQAVPQDAKEMAGSLQIHAQGKSVQLSFEIPEQKMIEMFKAKMKEAAYHKGPTQPVPK
jgi:hypothetical protein